MNTLWTKLSVVAAGTAIFALACTVTSGSNDGSSADDSASDDDVAADSGSTSTEDSSTTTDSGSTAATCGVADDQIVDTTCTACARTQCCTELSACWDDADCKAYAECVIDCQSKPDVDGGVDGCLKDVCSGFETPAILAKDDAWRGCIAGFEDADGGVVSGKCEAQCVK